MRLVLDTNVVVSALIARGAPRERFLLGENKGVDLFSSERLLRELARVLRGGKCAHVPDVRGNAPADLTLRYRLATQFVRLDDQAGRIAGLGPDTVDDGTKEGGRLATMHRVKGLEFDRIVIASVNAGLVPQPRAYAGAGDAAEREKAETKERALLHVAATRAKKELLILSYGTPSPFLS